MLFWQGDDQVFHTDSSGSWCVFDAKNSSVRNEDNFGF